MDVAKNPRLTRTRAAAGSLLALMVVLYAVARTYEAQWPWLVWVRAFAEAGMVGGLADWFAVTALFRHPLRLPIPHTAVIPREKDRIGRALAQFVRGNFLTPERICKQVKELRLIGLIAAWMTRPEKAEQLAQRTVQAVPTVLNALEQHSIHHQISGKLLDQLRVVQPAGLLEKLINWLLHDQRDRQMLAPVLAQLASVLEANKEKIEAAAGEKAPLKKVPLLGRISRAIAEDFSEKTAGSIGQRLIAASENPEEPLWEIIEKQLAAVQAELMLNDTLRAQLETIRDEWLDSPAGENLGERLWQQVRKSLARDLAKDSPVTAQHLASAISAAGHAIENDEGMAEQIEIVLLEAIGKILEKHGEQIETMIRETIEEWDANTLMRKLENQIGPDLQFIRINGTLIGGCVGVTLHAIGMLLWK